jgi:predicted dehydrogenase
MSALSSDRLAEPVLIAGLGSIGRRHFNNLRALGCTNFVFYRTYQSTMADPETGSWPSTSDLHEALSHRPKIAVISNPTSLHVEVARAAAEAGCHLFIEKPLSNSLDHCRELAELATQRGLTTMIGCQFRFHPLLISLRNQLRDGRLGKVLNVQAEWGEFLPDWHPWEDHRKSYSARPELGGGVVLTLIHPLDYLYWLFGPVSDVVAEIRDEPSLQTASEDDWAEIDLRFTGGQVAKVHLDFMQKPPVHRLVISADRGSANLDFHAGTLVWESADGGAETERVPKGFERNTMFLDEMKHFLEAVHERRASAIPIEEGINVLEIALKAKRSARPEVHRG